MSERGYILLIEDNPGDAQLTRLLLQDPKSSEAADLRWVTSLQQGLEMLDTPSPCAVVLLDLGLPDNLGLEAVHAIARHRQACPIVVLTGDETEAKGMAALAAGAQDFLVKGSFDSGLLFRCIRFAAQRKRAEIASVQRLAAAQTALTNSAERLREGMARVADGFVAFDTSRRFTYANARAVQLLGRASENVLLGRHVWSEFPRAVGTPFHEAFERAMTSQQPVRNEGYYPTTRRWLAGRLFPSADGLSIYFTDITDRRRAEDALRLSELRFRLAAAQGQVWDWNLAARKVSFPAPFWRQLGIEPPPEAELITRLEGLMHEADRARWRAALQAHIEQREPYDLEYRARHANGEWRWFHTQGQAVWDEKGRATFMAGTTFDITERKRAELGLRESEAYRRNLFEQMADAVVLTGKDCEILDANPQAAAMLGYSLDELLDLRIDAVVHAPQSLRMLAAASQACAASSRLTETELVRKDGSRFPAEIGQRRLEDGRVLSVARDISVRRASEDALLQFQFELSDLTQRLLTQEQETTRRVAQALHDRLGQTLAIARLNLEACVSTQGSNMPPALKQQSERLASLLDQAVREVRQVLAHLRPPLLEDQGLTAALDNEISAGIVPGAAADVLLEVDDGSSHLRWPEAVEYAAFMLAREAIANAMRHADASLIRVVLGGDARRLSLDVVDDGKGISPLLARGRPGHLGIVGMRERAIAIGARFTIENGQPGGTRVCLRWEAAP